MKKILLIGGTVFAFSLFLIVSNFSINSDNIEISMRSVDLTDFPAKRVIVLHETEIGNQYKNALIKSVPNTQWEETDIVMERTISENSVQKNITYEYYSEMPTPSQKVLDRAAEKAKNPMPRKTPLMEYFGNQMLTPPNEAINIDDYLDKVKKN